MKQLNEERKMSYEVEASADIDAFGVIYLFTLLRGGTFLSSDTRLEGFLENDPL